MPMDTPVGSPLNPRTGILLPDIHSEDDAVWMPWIYLPGFALNAGCHGCCPRGSELMEDNGDGWVVVGIG